MAITSNMHDALLALRNEEHSRLLWVIEVCVNQTDLEEREQQNELILDVYKRAHRVLLYGGPGSFDGE